MEGMLSSKLEDCSINSMWEILHESCLNMLTRRSNAAILIDWRLYSMHYDKLFTYQNVCVLAWRACEPWRWFGAKSYWSEIVDGEKYNMSS